MLDNASVGDCIWTNSSLVNPVGADECTTTWTTHSDTLFGAVECTNPDTNHNNSTIGSDGGPYLGVDYDVDHIGTALGTALG